MFSQNCPYPKRPKGEVSIKKIFGILQFFWKNRKVYAKNTPCRTGGGRAGGGTLAEAAGLAYGAFIKCVPPAGPEAVEQGAQLMREEDGNFMEAIVLPGWLFVLFRAFRGWGRAAR